MEVTKTDQLFLLGDYIDRGPDSKGVLDKIKALTEQSYQITTLRGNHEQSLINDHYSETKKGWFSMADDELLKSFAIQNLKELPVSYIEQCKSMPLHYITDEMVLVHAGINFETQNPLSDEMSLMWIRDWYERIDREWLGNRIIIHGHTPLTKFEIQDQFAQLDSLRILNIDCGACFYGKTEFGLGYLCAYDFTNNKLHFEENTNDFVN